MNACSPISRLDGRGDRRELLLRHVGARTLTQPAEDLHFKAVVPRNAGRILLVRDPELGRGREGEVLRHHADDLGGLAVHPHRAADDTRVGVEALGPQRVAQHHDRCSILHGVPRLDGAPELGRDTGHVENVAVGEGTVVALSLAVAGEVSRAHVDAAERLELLRRLANLEIVLRQHRIVVVARDLPVDGRDRVEAVRVRIRRGFEHQRVRDAVHEDHGAEAEPQHTGRKRREARRARETRDRGLELVEECAHG